ncbi:hypothetical protein E3N88_23298 [Mikania micrantha]|uniref:CCHC-type domain-containing protein n=1 Tax=Mikania micrantha TaxID=192012 RepID=A0A5N6NEQ7_9ASTR|nr:hypothetical protein E3N88_23298 [Mikania micrantha]
MGRDYFIAEFQVDQLRVGLERISPTSGKYLYKPDVPISCEPQEGMVFPSIEHAFEFYQTYAIKGGFTARRGFQICYGTVIKIKYIVCSKEGHKPTRDCNSNENKDEREKKINSIIAPDILSGIGPEVNKVVRDIMSSSEYIVNKLLKDMDKLTIFRDTLQEIMDKTNVETRGLPVVKQKDIVASFVPPQNDISTENVRVPSGIRNKGLGSHKRFKLKREQAISRMGKRSIFCHNCGQSGHDRRTCSAFGRPGKV